MLQIFNQQVQPTMTPENFAYWLQGFFEITGKDVTSLSPEQIQMIKTHLGYVFNNQQAPNPIDVRVPYLPQTQFDVTCSTPGTTVQAVQPFEKKSVFELLGADYLSSDSSIPKAFIC